MHVACSIPACSPPRVSNSLTKTNWSPIEGGRRSPPSGGLSMKWNALSLSTRRKVVNLARLALAVAAEIAATRAIATRMLAPLMTRRTDLSFVRTCDPVAQSYAGTDRRNDQFGTG